MQFFRKSKYFSVMMDCTPDISHNEQLSLVLRIVNCESLVEANIAEHFVGFVNVNDTTGKSLFDTLIEHLNSFRLNISDCRGQSYDNGINMMGHKQGVQKRLLEINNKALCVPCSSHSLNLVVADAAKAFFSSCITSSAHQYNAGQSCKAMCSSLSKICQQRDGNVALTV